MLVTKKGTHIHYNIVGIFFFSLRFFIDDFPKGRRKKLDQGTLGMSDPLQLTFDQLGTDRTSIGTLLDQLRTLLD